MARKGVWFWRLICTTCTENETVERDNGDHHGDHHPTGRRVRDPPRRFEKENHVLVRSGETHREGRTRATVCASSAKLGMRTGRGGGGLANSHRKAKDTLRKTKMMRDASDRQVNQAMLGILTVIFSRLDGIWDVCDCSPRERRRREWAEKVES